MNKKMNKSIMTGILSLAMVVSGLVWMPNKEVQAAEAATIEYVTVEKEDFAELVGKTAPTKDGYLFAGWVAQKTDNTGVAIKTAEDEVLSETGVTITAKFIKANLTGVACQVKANTYEEGVTGTEMRIVSVVDGGEYEKFGFNLYKRVLNETTGEYTETEIITYDESATTLGIAESTERYTGLYQYKSLTEKEVKTPADIFGSDATGTDTNQFYFTTVRVGTIPKALYDTCSLVIRPYWITVDGTYVEGLAEYDRVSDGKNEIVNVSVNIKEAEDIAAGRMTVSYDDTNYEYVSADTGRVFEEMEINGETAGTVTCVGNVADIKQNSENADDVFVNLRFKKLTNLTAGTSSFTVSDTAFCNIDEVITNAKVLDVKY